MFLILTQKLNISFQMSYIAEKSSGKIDEVKLESQAKSLIEIGCNCETESVDKKDKIVAIEEDSNLNENKGKQKFILAIKIISNKIFFGIYKEEAKLIEETPKNSTHIAIEIEELQNTNLEAVTQHSETTAEGKL